MSIASIGDGRPGVVRQQSLLERAGSGMKRAGSNLGLQKASTLPLEEKALRHAATMPMMFDVETDRPCCCGMWKTQQMVGFLLGVALLVASCAARPIHMYPQANDMLGITALCGAFWVFEVVPIYITALAPLILMPLLEVTSSQIAAQSYWNQVQMLVVGTYLVDIALEEVHLPRRASLKLLLATGVVQPGVLLFAFMALCWILSMFCNSIAVTLMISPFAIGLMNAAEDQARDAAAAEAAQSESSSEDSEAEIDLAVREVQRFADGVMLGIAYSATCGGIATLTGAIPNEVLMGMPDVNGQVTYRRWMWFAFPVSLATFLMAYAVLYFRYVHGLNLKGMTHEVLEAEHEELVKEVGPFSRDELVVGLIQILQFVLLFIRPFIASLIETPYGETLLGDPTLAVLPAVLLFFIPSVVHPGRSVLTWPAVHEKFDFGLLLLIGGGFAIASGFTQSGLNVALGQGIASTTENRSPYVVNLVIVSFCTIATQVFSAVGTATTVMPALHSAALNAVRNPLGLMLPATVACSFAFMLPTATPANVVVLAKSQDLARPLRVRDFVFAGFPINIMAIAVASVLLFWTADLIFQADSPFPEWACDSVSCLWLPVPGVTYGGEHVEKQACILVDSINTTELLCSLWNETKISVAPYLDELQKEV